MDGIDPIGYYRIMITDSSVPGGDILYVQSLDPVKFTRIKSGALITNSDNGYIKFLEQYLSYGETCTQEYLRMPDVDTLAEL